MYSFYEVEGSCGVGAGVGSWTLIDVRNNLPEIQQAARQYFRSGWWLPLDDPDEDHTFVLRVYQAGELATERDLHPFIQLKVPGLTEIRYDEGYVIGGTPEPGGSYDGLSDDELREKLSIDFADSAGQEQSAVDPVELVIDWERMALPGLIKPVLPEGTSVVNFDDQDLKYGLNHLE